MKKYLHIIDQRSSVFTFQVIQLINDELGYSDNNLFVTFDDKLVEKCYNYGNVSYSSDLVKYINDNYKNYDYIFIHAMNFKLRELLKIKKKAIEKFIWCVWGHDLYPKQEKGLTPKIKKLLKHNILKRVYGVGIGFEYDKYQIYELLSKNTRIFWIPYGYIKGIDETYSKVYNNPIKNNETRVLIGHSGYPFLNHKELINKLTKYKNEKIKVCLVLSYGEKDYIEDVKEYAISQLGKDKVEIITDLMEDMEYLQYLNGIDIAIFDYKHQAALGNIYRLLYLGKKIFLDRSGIIYKECIDQQLTVFSVDEIENQFENFKRKLTKIQKEKNHKFGYQHISDKIILEAWKEFFKEQEASYEK